jgi:hypothetical protein
MPSNIRSTPMIPVPILIQHINRERGQSRRYNTHGAETIPGTSKTGNIGDKVHFKVSYLFTSYV